MVNWKTISIQHPKSFARLLRWLSEQFPSGKVSVDMVDMSGQASEYHLQVSITRIPIQSKIGMPKNKKVAVALPAPIVNTLFFQFRELFDFFDDQNIDITIMPAFKQIVGVTSSKRLYRLIIHMEGNKVYPTSSDVFGEEFGSRRDAEVSSFEKAFEVLELQLALSGHGSE